MSTYEDPFKLRVLKALSASLKQITPDNGCIYDLTDFDPGDGVDQERVIRGRDWFGATDPIPMVSILEGVAPGDEVAEPPQPIADAEIDWQILIQGWVVDDPVHSTDPAYRLLADVRRRLKYESKRTLPGDPSERDIFGLRSAGPSLSQVTGFRFGTGVVRPADDVSANAWFWLSATIRIVEDSANPYD